MMLNVARRHIFSSLFNYFLQKCKISYFDNIVVGMTKKQHLNAIDSGKSVTAMFLFKFVQMWKIVTTTGTTPNGNFNHFLDFSIICCEQNTLAESTNISILKCRIDECKLVHCMQKNYTLRALTIPGDKRITRFIWLLRIFKLFEWKSLFRMEVWCLGYSHGTSSRSIYMHFAGHSKTMYTIRKLVMAKILGALDWAHRTTEKQTWNRTLAEINYDAGICHCRLMPDALLWAVILVRAH